MSEDDLVLCERAAKAAGVKVRRVPNIFHLPDDWPNSSVCTRVALRVVDDDHGLCGSKLNFAPLHDDGQAFRLAMQQRMDITTGRYGYTVHQKTSGVTIGGEWSPDDINEGLRRAIVRVAAEQPS